MNLIAFNGDVLRELAAQFLALARSRSDRSAHDRRIASWVTPCLVRVTSRRVERISIERIALYDPIEHRPLATRFGQTLGCQSLCDRSLALWMLGYPEAALVDADHALSDAREIGQAATLHVRAEH